MTTTTPQAPTTPELNWKEHEGHFVKEAKFCQLVASRVLSGDGSVSYMGLARFPAPIDGVTNGDGDKWFPVSEDQLACMAELDQWWDHILGTKEKEEAFLKEKVIPCWTRLGIISPKEQQG